jgi:hypothetical protein
MSAGQDTAKPVITIADEALVELRKQIRSLVGLIDTARRPNPDGVIPSGKDNAGPVWTPFDKWVIRTLPEADDPSDFIYVTTPLDWEGDYTAMRLEDARALAMSLLAACEWAERGGPSVAGRYPALDEDSRPTGLTLTKRGEQ